MVSSAASFPTLTPLSAEEPAVPVDTCWRFLLSSVPSEGRGATLASVNP